MSLRKLADATGIAPAHLEAMVHGRFDDLPSAPYVRGYLVRLGKVLDFNGEEWWEKIKKEGAVENSGSGDALPHNRFTRSSPTKFIWIGIAVAIVLIYLVFQLPIIFGRPVVAITFPTQNPYTATSNTLTLQGTERKADSLYLQAAGGEQDQITISPDGSWQKTVLLQNGVNSFTVSAKKLLGGQANVTIQILYQGAPATSSSSTASSTNNASSVPSVHFYQPGEVPATGTFYQ